MFDNIGKKIKTLAVTICVIGVAASVIVGITFIYGLDSFGLSGFVKLENRISAGILVIVFGSFISWIGSFFTYGFGELIDSNQAIEKQLKSLVNSHNIP